MTDEDCNPPDSRNLFGDPLPAIRTVFGGGATLVYGWPSTGGVWVHESCYGIELNFLNLSRFEPSDTERFSERENEFCKRLEWIGGRFYKSEDDYDKDMERDWRDRRQDPYLWCGWPGVVPEGGVWALWTQGSEGPELGVSRIRNALIMEERCRAIETLGGKFYEKWEDVAEARTKSHGDKKVG